MSVLSITVILIVCLVILLASGLPVAFALGGLSLLFILLEFGTRGLFVMASSAWESWSDGIFDCCPAFCSYGKIPGKFRSGR